MTDETPDTSQLPNANTNPWYVLMTLYGEQEGKGINWELAEKNRRLWNAWSCQGMTEERRAEIAEKIGIEVEETEWTPEKESLVHILFAKRLKRTKPAPNMPRPDDEIDLQGNSFTENIELNHFIFGPISFRNSHFGRTASFIGAYFGGISSFFFSEFEGDAIFNNATFFRKSVFDRARFKTEAHFADTDFDGKTSFSSAYFSCRTFFDNSRFRKEVVFSEAYFGRDAFFGGAHFGGDMLFDASRFEGLAGFNRIQAEGLVSFRGESILDDEPVGHFGTFADFSESRFNGRVNFSLWRFGLPENNQTKEIRFDSAVFEGPVSFERAEFPHVMPVFSNTTLPPLTKVTVELPASATKQQKDDLWPKLPGPLNWITGRVPFRKGQSYAQIKESAGALRHAMARQMLPEEEHFFFRREMYAGARCGPWLQGLLTRVFFELPSNYGSSIGRPAFALLAFWLLGAFAFFVAATVCVPASSSCSGTETFGPFQALGYSFANMFKFFGLHRTYFDFEVIQAWPGWLQWVSGAQTVLAFILLFFLGLGLRTRFRLR